MLAPQAELPIPRCIGGRDHPAVTGRDDLARMEREAGDVAVRLADPFPGAVPQNLAANRAGCVLDQYQAVVPRQRHQTLQIARHADLMHRENRPGLRPDHRRDAIDVDVERLRVDVDEDRHGAAVADRVRGGDERMADRDDFVPGTDAGGEQRQVQRGRAIGHGAGVGGADRLGELTFEGGDFRPLREPPRTDHPRGGVDFGIADQRLRDRNRLNNRRHDADFLRPRRPVPASTTRPDPAAPPRDRSRSRSRASASPSPRRRGVAAPG